MYDHPFEAKGVEAIRFHIERLEEKIKRAESGLRVVPTHHFKKALARQQNRREELARLKLLVHRTCKDRGCSKTETLICSHCGARLCPECAREHAQKLGGRHNRFVSLSPAGDSLGDTSSVNRGLSLPGASVVQF